MENSQSSLKCKDLHHMQPQGHHPFSSCLAHRQEPKSSSMPNLTDDQDHELRQRCKETVCTLKHSLMQSDMPRLLNLNPKKCLEHTTAQNLMANDVR